MRLTTSAALAALVGLATPAVAGVPCPPAVVVSGDPTTAAAVRALLSQHGVSMDVAPGCPRLTVTVQPAREGITTMIDDGAHRTARLVVADAAIAAAVAESWARADLAAPLLAAPPGWARLESASRASAAPPLRAASLPVDLSLMAGGAGASDGSTWIDLDVAACVRWGWACVGVDLRWTFDSNSSGTSELLATRRIGLDVLVTVDAPLHLGPLTLAPGIGLGAGWLRSTPSKAISSGDIVEDGGGPRVEARLGLALPLADHLSVALGTTFDLAPFAHTATIVDEGVSIAGNPRWSLRVGLGLRYSFE